MKKSLVLVLVVVTTVASVALGLSQANGTAFSVSVQVPCWMGLAAMWFVTIWGWALPIIALIGLGYFIGRKTK